MKLEARLKVICIDTTGQQRRVRGIILRGRKPRDGSNKRRHTDGSNGMVHSQNWIAEESSKSIHSTADRKGVLFAFLCDIIGRNFRGTSSINLAGTISKL